MNLLVSDLFTLDKQLVLKSNDAELQDFLKYSFLQESEGDKVKGIISPWEDELRRMLSSGMGSNEFRKSISNGISLNDSHFTTYRKVNICSTTFQLMNEIKIMINIATYKLPRITEYLSAAGFDYRIAHKKSLIIAKHDFRQLTLLVLLWNPFVKGVLGRYDKSVSNTIVFNLSEFRRELTRLLEYSDTTFDSQDFALRDRVLTLFGWKATEPKYIRREAIRKAVHYFNEGKVSKVLTFQINMMTKRRYEYASRVVDDKVWFDKHFSPGGDFYRSKKLLFDELKSDFHELLQKDSSFNEYVKIFSR